jgi:hypothetical protein
MLTYPTPQCFTRFLHYEFLNLARQLSQAQHPLVFRQASGSRRLVRSSDMSDLFWLSDAQVARLKPLQVVAGLRTMVKVGRNSRKSIQYP